MKIFRLGTFETNSSSTHSIAILSKEDFNKWKKGDLYMNDCWNDPDKILPQDCEFVCKDDVIKYLKHYHKYEYCEGNCDIDELLFEDGIYSYERWGSDYEHDTTEYTTPNGEQLVIECYYGQEY